ncbi:hypothetical protein ES705_43199 [subsurface metagenome]
MADIIIYTTEENLIHKKGLKKGEKKFKEFYWTFKSLPKNLEIGDKIYFATKDYILQMFQRIISSGLVILGKTSHRFQQNHFKDLNMQIKWRD